PHHLPYTTLLRSVERVHALSGPPEEDVLAARALDRVVAPGADEPVVVVAAFDLVVAVQQRLEEVRRAVAEDCRGVGLAVVDREDRTRGLPDPGHGAAGGHSRLVIGQAAADHLAGLAVGGHIGEAARAAVRAFDDCECLGLGHVEPIWRNQECHVSRSPRVGTRTRTRRGAAVRRGRWKRQVSADFRMPDGRVSIVTSGLWTGFRGCPAGTSTEWREGGSRRPLRSRVPQAGGCYRPSSAAIWAAVAFRTSTQSSKPSPSSR